MRDIDRKIAELDAEEARQKEEEKTKIDLKPVTEAVIDKTEKEEPKVEIKIPESIIKKEETPENKSSEFVIPDIKIEPVENKHKQTKVEFSLPTIDSIKEQEQKSVEHKTIRPKVEVKEEPKPVVNTNTVIESTNKPKINVDVDSVVLNNNIVSDDEFFDDFFGDDDF
jgi:hypothetical protein